MVYTTGAKTSHNQRRPASWKINSRKAGCGATFNPSLGSQLGTKYRLEALREDSLVDLLTSYTPQESISPLAHEKLLTLLRDFMLVGGMPEAVYRFAQTKDPLEAIETHRSILEGKGYSQVPGTSSARRDRCYRCSFGRQRRTAGRKRRPNSREAFPSGYRSCGNRDWNRDRKTR